MKDLNLNKNEDNTELLDNLLSGNEEKSRSTTITKSPNQLDKETRELVVTNLMNQAFICIYDGNNEEAINIFRQI